MDHTEFMSISPVPGGEQIGNGVLANYSYDPMTSIDPGTSSAQQPQPMRTLGQFEVDSADDVRLQSEHNLALRQSMDTVMNSKDANVSHSDIENSSMFEFLDFPDKPQPTSLTFV